MSELYVSVSPHIRSPRTTQTIMRDVLIALCPALIASCIIFGARALLVSAVCVAASVLFEFLYQKGTKQPVTISDCSAAVTGLILAMNLPVTIPLWPGGLWLPGGHHRGQAAFRRPGQELRQPRYCRSCGAVPGFLCSMTNWVFPDAVSTATPWRSSPRVRWISSPPCGTLFSVGKAAAWVKPAPWHSSPAAST